MTIVKSLLIGLVMLSLSYSANVTISGTVTRYRGCCNIRSSSETSRRRAEHNNRVKRWLHSSREQYRNYSNACAVLSRISLWFPSLKGC